MKITVVGAGYAGLAVCWHLLQNPAVEATLIDGGGGASRASTGLLYPFPARTAARSWMATEGLQATRELIDIAELAMGQPVANRGGILRMPAFPWQKASFAKLVRKNSDAFLRGEDLWVPSGMAIYSELYLEGLLKACLAKGAILKRERIDDLRSLDADHIVLAVGSEIGLFANLPLHPVKGRSLLCRLGEPLPYSLVGNGHITPTQHPDFCMVGSTYESEFDTPNSQIASQLLEKVATFFPPARDFEVVEVMAGTRMSAIEGYRPIVKQIAPNTYIIAGLGSRGLLYHALLGKQVAQSIFSQP